MNDITLITRTLSITPQRLAMVSEALWNRLAFEQIPKYDPIFELALATFIKKLIQGFYSINPDIPFDATNATEYTRYHLAAIYNLYQKAKK